MLLCFRSGLACLPHGLRRRCLKPQRTGFADAVATAERKQMLSQSHSSGHCKVWSCGPEKWGFVTTGLLKPKNILYTVLHSDDLILSKTSLWDLWFWLSIWAQGTVLPSYLTGRGFVMRHLLCFWSKYFCDKCYIKTHKDVNNRVFSEEFKWHAINKAKATHWLKKVGKNPTRNTE